MREIIMNDIFNELVQLKQNIIAYMELKNKDFEASKSSLNDYSRFSSVVDYSRMSDAFREMEMHANYYRNASNFLKRLESISTGITLNSGEDKLIPCVSAYLILKATDEHRIITDEMVKRFSMENGRSL